MIVANLHRLGLARRARDDAVSLRPLNAQRFFEREARLRDPEIKEIQGSTSHPEGGGGGDSRLGSCG